MKKILFIPYTFSNGGGAERILSETIRNIDNSKYQITVLPYADYHVKEEYIPNYVNLMQGIVDMDYAHTIKNRIRHLAVYLCPRLLHKKYVHDVYDIEIAFNYQIPSFLVQTSKDTKSIMWVHTDVYDLKKRAIRRFLQHRSFKKATAIVAISENTEKSIKELFPQTKDKIVRIYNGINIEQIQLRAKESCEITLKPNAIMFSGRLEDRKNPLAIIETAHILKQQGKDYPCYIMGQGELLEQVKEKINEYGLNEQVTLLGYQQNPYPLFAQASIICMQSQAEGFPTVFAEGMALGKPFVSTNVSGTSEMSNNGQCGIIIDSPQACANAIIKLLENENLYQEMSKNCVEHIQNFSMDRQKAELDKLLNSVLEV